jgi:hypothetical protein
LEITISLPLETPNVAIVSYVSPALLSAVQMDAKRSNQSVARMVREALEERYAAKQAERR